MQGDEFLCKKPLVESYGIFSYTSAAREKLILCPSVKATCCPAYEQFKLFDNYNKKIKPYFKVFEQVISKSIELMKGRITKFFGLNIPEKISKMKSNSGRLLMGDKFNQINHQERILLVLTEMQTRLPTTLEYMDHLKSLFFCTICGYGNQQFIDIPTKSISFSSESCDSLVRNTFQFSYLMNNLLLPFIMTSSEFMVKAMKDKQHRVLKLKPLTIINKAIDECAKDYRDLDEGLNNCLAYCSFFKLNRNTPEIEGYPELFFNFLVQMDAFIATGGVIKEKAAPAKKEPKKPEPPKEDNKTKPKLRLLEELLGNTEYLDIKYRILEEKAKQEAPKKKGPGEDFVDPFDQMTKMIKMQLGNIFEVEGVDPNFDDAAMAELIALQSLVEKEGDPDGLDSFIRQHYADNYEPEIEDIDSKEVFSRPGPERIHLDTFQSKFGFSGIDFTHLMRKVDWNMNMHTLVNSLKGTDKPGPSNDHLDLKVVELVNSVDNKFAIRFHRDNFRKFDGTHLHQPNNVIKSLNNYLNDKANEEYVKTTQRAINLVENTQGAAVAGAYKKKIMEMQEKFAYKVALAMIRVNDRLKNSDLTQLKEIEDKIANATMEQLIQLQADMLEMKSKCAGDNIKKRHCRVAYNKLADLFDLDPLYVDVETEAQELLSLQMKYKVRDRLESVEEMKMDQEALDKIEEECSGEKQKTEECQKKLFQYGVIYQVDPLSATFYDEMIVKIEKLIKKAEEKAKVPEGAEDAGEEQTGGDDQANQNAGGESQEAQPAT